jgi:Holliday junction resolvase
LAPRPYPIGHSSTRGTAKLKVKTLSLRDIAEKTKPKSKRKGRKLSSNESKRIRLHGYRAERDLVKKLRVKGYKAVRVPVSAPSSEPLPDVFATKDGCILAFEVKSTSSDRIYFKQEQVRKIVDFLSMFEVYDKKKVILAGKFPYKWVFKVADKIDNYIIRDNDESSKLVNS